MRQSKTTTWQIGFVDRETSCWSVLPSTDSLSHLLNNQRLKFQTEKSMKNNEVLADQNGSRVRPVLVLRESDNVGVVRTPLSAGSIIEVGERKIEVRETIVPGHKIALRPITEGSP